MKKMGMSLSFLLVALMVLAPALATLAHAWGSGGAGAAGGAGAGAGASGGAAAGGGAAGGGAAGGGAAAGGAAAGGAGAPSGGSPSSGPASSSGSPSSSPGISASPASDDNGSPSASPDMYERPRAEKKLLKKDSQAVSPSASVATGDFVGRHTMTGTVTRVNPDKGTFRLKTSEGTFDLHAPPSALAGVQKGDQLNVEIAIQPLR